jgi:hypothetical protein
MVGCIINTVLYRFLHDEFNDGNTKGVLYCIWLLLSAVVSALTLRR